MATVEEHSNSSKSSSEEEKMNVYLKVTKTVALVVTKSDTIRHLKAVMREKESVSENFQELFYGGKCLKDDKNLIDCGIQGNSTLHLVLQTSGVVKLTVRISSQQKTIVVEAKRHDTIHNVKLMIQEKEGISSDTFTLLYIGKLLENDWMLSSLGVKDEAILNLVFNPREIVTLSVKLPSGKIVKTEVRNWYTVCDVKEIVGSVSGFSVNDHNLVYEGKQLEDSLTLAGYDINEISVLEILPVKFQIFVKLWSGKTITLDVRKQDTVSCVKSKIFEKLGKPEDIPCYYLVYAGKCLGDDQDLVSLGVGRQSTLYVKVRVSTFYSFIELSEIKETDGLPEETTTIGHLMELIGRKLKNPVKEVLVNGKALREDQTMADCGLEKSTKLAVITN